MPIDFLLTSFTYAIDSELNTGDQHRGSTPHHATGHCLIAAVTGQATEWIVERGSGG